LAWTAPAGVVLGYGIVAGTAPGLTNAASVVVGTATSITAPGAPGRADLATVPVGAVEFVTFNFPVGTYFVRVQAQNAFGSSAPSEAVRVAVDGAPALEVVPGSVRIAAFRGNALVYGVVVSTSAEVAVYPQVQADLISPTDTVRDWSAFVLGRSRRILSTRDVTQTNDGTEVRTPNGTMTRTGLPPGTAAPLLLFDDSVAPGQVASMEKWVNWIESDAASDPAIARVRR
jgi:hypothetical protein